LVAERDRSRARAREARAQRPKRPEKRPAQDAGGSRTDHNHSAKSTGKGPEITRNAGKGARIRPKWPDLGLKSGRAAAWAPLHGARLARCSPGSPLLTPGGDRPLGLPPFPWPRQASPRPRGDCGVRSARSHLGPLSPHSGWACDSSSPTRGVGVPDRSGVRTPSGGFCLNTVGPIVA